MSHDDQTTHKVLSNFFEELRKNPLIKEKTILALETLDNAGELVDAAAIQTVIRDSLGEDDAAA